MSELSKEEWIEKAAWVLKNCCVHTEPEDECPVCELLKQLESGEIKTPSVKQMKNIQEDQEKEDKQARHDLQAIAHFIDKLMPYGWGFVVLAFPFGSGGRMNYVANAERVDVVRAMYEFIEASKEQWGEHDPPIGAAAEDEQLGRARQEVAELKRLVSRSAAALECFVDYPLPFVEELRKASQ